LSQKVTPPGVAWDDWMIATELAAAMGADLGFETIDDVAQAAGTHVDTVNGDGAVIAPTLSGAMPATPEINLPALDAYSLRLVAGRMLYDNGWSVQASPSLANLVKPVVMRANQRDLDRLGVSSGGQVRVSGARANFVVHAVADAGVPAGSCWMPVNVAADDARSLIDSSGPVTDVRIENIK
jgi:predicted molibdopterin-dependent oxidoreductase YjgC